MIEGSASFTGTIRCVPRVRGVCRYVTRWELLEIFDRLSDSELAMLIGFGGSLPQQSRNRAERMQRAAELYNREAASLAQHWQERRI